MASTPRSLPAGKVIRAAVAGGLLATLGACAQQGLGQPDGVTAPGVAGSAEDNMIIGHRLMEAGQHELALRAYSRAVLEDGLTPDTLAALGSANLGLGRLGQAESLLRRAVEADDGFSPAWNNLGVVLMSKGEVSEATEAFRRAFATSSGESDEIRANLERALSRRDETRYVPDNNDNGFRLIYRGYGDVALQSPSPAPDDGQFP